MSPARPPQDPPSSRPFESQASPPNEPASTPSEAAAQGRRTVALERAAKPRPRSERLMAAIRPLVRPIVAGLARLGVDPQAVVLTHSVLGIVAAVLVGVGGPGPLEPLWLSAAILLQVKTVLDNVDGGLARATDRVTEMGRYLDTVMDLVVNLALFGALALHGPPVVSGLGFVVLMLVLSFDHNLERRYQHARGRVSDAAEAPPGAPAAWLSLVRGVYARVLAPQDRAIERIDEALFAWARGVRSTTPSPEDRRTWSDLFSTATLVDLGLSTQLFAFGVLLVAGRPFAYVWLVLAQGVYLVCIQLLRVARFRRYRSRQ